MSNHYAAPTTQAHKNPPTHIIKYDDESEYTITHPSVFVRFPSLDVPDGYAVSDFISEVSLTGRKTGTSYEWIVSKEPDGSLLLHPIRSLLLEPVRMSDLDIIGVTENQFGSPVMDYSDDPLYALAKVDGLAGIHNAQPTAPTQLPNDKSPDYPSLPSSLVQEALAYQPSAVTSVVSNGRNNSGLRKARENYDSLITSTSTQKEFRAWFGLMDFFVSKYAADYRDLPWMPTVRYSGGEVSTLKVISQCAQAGVNTLCFDRRNMRSDALVQKMLLSDKFGPKKPSRLLSPTAASFLVYMLEYHDSVTSRPSTFASCPELYYDYVNDLWHSLDTITKEQVMELTFARSSLLRGSYRKDQWGLPSNDAKYLLDIQAVDIIVNHIASQN